MKFEDLYEFIGNKVKEHRKIQKLSLLKLASKTGMSIAAVYRVENCIGNPPVLAVTKIINALDISFTEKLLQP